MTRRRWVSLIVVAVLVGVPAALITSETALRFAARVATERIDALEIAGLRGRLVSGVTAQRVRWGREGGPVVTVDELDARWRLLPALAGRLYLARLDAANVTVALPAPRIPDADEPPREVRLPDRIEIPVVVRIGALTVGTVTITRGGRELITVEHIDAAGVYADPRTFSVERFAAVGDPLSLELSATVTPAGAWPTEVDARWRLLLPDRPRLDGRLVAQGALDRDFEVRLSTTSGGGADAGFRGTLRNLIRAPSLVGELEVDAWHPRLWAAAAPASRVSARLELDGWIEDLAVTGTVDADVDGWPHATVEADARWGKGLVALRTATVRSRDLDTVLTASGHVDWTGERPVGTVRAAWERLAWPLQGDALFFSRIGRGTLDLAGDTGRVEVAGHLGDDSDGRVRARADLLWLAAEPAPRVDVDADWEELVLFGLRSDRGRASAQGSIDDWAGASTLHLVPPATPEMTLALEVVGDLDGLRASTVHADWLDGTATGTAAVRWRDGVDASAELRVIGVDPGAFVPDFDGHIGGLVSATVRAGDGGVRWLARLRDGDGTLHGRPFNARADVGGLGAEVERLDVVASVGEARLSVAGEFAPSLSVEWRVDIPDLGLIVPEASGSLRGHGQARGDPDAPALGFELVGDELAYADWFVTRLSGDGALDLGGQTGARAVLRAHAITVGEQAIDSIAFTVSGPADALTLAIDAHADDLRAAVRAGGAWSDGAFGGRLERASVGDGDDSPWHLVAPADLAFGGGAARLVDACWRQSETTNELCAALDWRADRGLSARAELSGLPLSELSAWLPLGFVYTGRIGGHAEVEWPAGGQPVAEGRLAVSDGAWLHMIGDEAVPLIQWRDASLEGRMADGTVHATAAFELVDGGRLDATVAAPVLDTEAGPAGERPLTARVQGAFSDFDLVPALVPDIGTMSGEVRADLSVSGTITQPLFAGTLEIAGGTTTVPRLGLRITELALDVDGDREMLTLRGGAKSGPGRITLEGRFGVRDGRVTGDARLRGDDFEAIRIPEANVNVSPNLDVAVRGHAVSVEGDVLVPYARFAPRELGGTVNASADEVLIDGPQQDRDADPWRVNARVRIALGDVQFEGFGLTANVTGALTAVDEPGELTRASGELQVRDGRYRAWGQQLDIEHGRLVFTGGPVTQPGIDVLAVRRPREDVTVGVNVRGTLREPELRLYSEPSMPQAEQLSWLVLGTPIGATTGSEQALLDRTRDTAGLAGGNLVVRELGRRLGISDVGIERGDSAEEAALVIGHYLSPRLYIGYGIGIFDPNNSLRVRYHIDRNWSIEAETGERSTSTDIRFTIER